MKTLLFIAFAFGFSLSNYSQSNSCDSILIKKLDEITVLLKTDIQLKDCDSREKKIKEEIKKLEKKNKTLTDKKVQLVADSIKSKIEIKDLNKGKDSLQEENNDRAKQITQLNKEKDELNTEKDELKKQKDELKKQKDEFENQILQIKKDLAMELEANLMNKEKLDSSYIKSCIIKLKNDPVYSAIVTKGEAYKKNQDKFNKIDAIMKLETYDSSKDTLQVFQILKTIDPSIEKHKKIKNEIETNVFKIITIYDLFIAAEKEASTYKSTLAKTTINEKVGRIRYDYLKYFYEYKCIEKECQKILKKFP